MGEGGVVQRGRGAEGQRERAGEQGCRGQGGAGGLLCYIF